MVSNATRCGEGSACRECYPTLEDVVKEVERVLSNARRSGEGSAESGIQC